MSRPSRSWQEQLLEAAQHLGGAVQQVEVALADGRRAQAEVAAERVKGTHAFFAAAEQHTTTPEERARIHDRVQEENQRDRATEQSNDRWREVLGVVKFLGGVAIVVVGVCVCVRFTRALPTTA